jgi:DNA mismatch repair protein MutS2
MSEYKTSLIQKLDLDGYIERFSSYLARAKTVAMQGDVNQHYRYIEALQATELKPLPELPPLKNQLARLQKQALMSIDDIYSFVKMVDYFLYLKSSSLPLVISSWIETIEIPSEVSEISNSFTNKGEINSQTDEALRSIEHSLAQNKREIKEALQKAMRSSNLADFLVDTQVHFIHDEETLLVRGGFMQVIKATVVGRTPSGHFYILPDSVSNLKAKQSALRNEKELIIYRYCVTFSAILSKWEKFLNFLNNQYDRFDHYYARVVFARANDYEFILPNKSSKVILSDFAHPAIANPIPVSVSIVKKIMLVTGVNAGGKTMLLKSILSSVYMSKYLLPFRCNKETTSIGHFGRIEAIIDDPQSVSNDISTFAGRMVEFAKLFEQKNAIVGVDEIELGTDSDEAASLFRVMLDTLSKRNITFIVTTHHKRLAALMASHEEVELMAALYDEHRRLPTYKFLQGSIGKSYAFETAQRYGVPVAIVEKAKVVHGEDHERLGELIERSTALELEMRAKSEALDNAKVKIEKKLSHLERLEEELHTKYEQKLGQLEHGYSTATNQAREAVSATESREGRRLLNTAHKTKIKTMPAKEEKSVVLEIGDSIKYRSHRGELLGIAGDEATIIVDGMKMRVPLSQLKKLAVNQQVKKAKQPKPKVTVEKGEASISIKLIGMFGDEAIDELDRFISNALVHNFNEVQVIHGGGAGILAKLVSEYLTSHPKISKFYRMQGNLGITIVEL